MTRPSDIHRLADEEPLAAFAPDHAILIDSLSKRLAPGIAVGFLKKTPVQKFQSQGLQVTGRDDHLVGARLRRSRRERR